MWKRLVVTLIMQPPDTVCPDPFLQLCLDEGRVKLLGYYYLSWFGLG